MASVIRIGPDTLPERDTVDIFDHKFTIRRVTRSVQKKLEAADRKVVESQRGDDSDKFVAALVAGLDELLEPDGDGKPAKTVLLDLWKKDQLSLDQFNELYEGIQEAAVKRPT